MEKLPLTPSYGKTPLLGQVYKKNNIRDRGITALYIVTVNFQINFSIP